MLKLEGEVHDFAQMTTNKMLASAGKSVFDVKEAFNCFTADVISQYAFGEPMGFVAQETWEPNLATWTSSFFRSAYMMRHNALGRKMAQVLPFMADYLGEDIRSVMNVMNVMVPGYIKAALKNPDNGRVFAEVMGGSKTLTEEEKFRYSGEGFNFLLAGTETTAVSPPILKLKRKISDQDTSGNPYSLYLLGPRQTSHLHTPYVRFLQLWPHPAKHQMGRPRETPLLVGYSSRVSAYDARGFTSLSPNCA
jgi:hypothetical protein